jgi:hypothetical protein
MMDETKIRNIICGLPDSQREFITVKIVRELYINTVVSVALAIKYSSDG